MDIATLRMAVDSTQVARSQRDLDGLTAKAGQTEAAVTRMSSRSSAAFGEMSGFITQVASVLAAANLAQQYIKIADGVTQLNNQLKLAMGNAQGAAQAYGDLYKIAQASRVSFTDLASTFAQIRRATEDTGLSYSRLLTVTEAIGNSMAITGGSTQGMNAALVQFTQGLSSGVLRGEELNSVLEQNSRLAQAIADGMGIERGQLRALGQEGKLTSDIVIKALESQAQVLKNEVAGATLTVASANVTLGTSITNIVGTIDKATGISGLFANELKQISQELDHLNWVMKMTEKEGGGAFMQMLNALGAAVGRFSFSLLSNTFSKFNWAVNKLTGGLFGLNEQVDLMPMNLENTDSQMKLMEHSVKAAGERVEKLREALGRVPDNIYLKDELASTTRFIEKTKAAIEAQKELANGGASPSNVSVGSGDVQLLRAQNKEWAAGAAARQKYLDDAKTGAQKFAEEMKKAKEAFAGAVDPSVEKHLREKYLKPTQEVKEAARMAKEEMKRMAEIDKDAGKQVDDVWKKTDALNDQVKKLNMNKVALEELTLAELENQMVSLQATDRVIPGYITALEAQIKAQKELIAASKKAELDSVSEKAAEKAAQDWARAAQKIEDSLTDALMRGFEKGKGFGENLKESLENLFKTMVLRPFIMATIGGIGFGGSGGAMAQSFGVGDFAKVMSGGSSLMNFLSGKSISSSISGGWTNSADWLSTSGNGTMANAGSWMQSNPQFASYAGMAGNAFAGYGLQKGISGDYSIGNGKLVDALTIAASAYFGPVAGVVGGIVNRAFGMGSKNVTGESLRGSFGESGADTSSVQNWSQKGGWFRSGRSGVNITAVTGELDKFMDDAVGGMFTASREAAKILGLNSDAINGFTKSIDINLMGLTAEQRTKAINDALGGFGEELAQKLGAESMDALIQYAAQVKQERVGLENQLLQLQGDTVEIRKREREQLHETNRALYDQIKALEDSKKAQEDSKKAQEDSKKAQEEFSRVWQGLSDNMMAEAKQLRDLNVSQSASNGLSYLQSQFAINTAAARSGDQTAAGMLPKLSQSIADAAMLNATSSAEVAVLRGQMAASLEETSRIVTGQPVNINAPIQTASAAEDTKAMRQQIEFLNERIQTLTENTQAENQAMVTMTNKIVRILQDVSQEGQSLSVTVVA